MTRKAENEARKAEAIELLKTRLSKQDKPTIYTKIGTVARSGMSRTLSLYIVDDGGIWDITGYAAQILGERYRDDGTIRVQGCGMDMGFATVYNLSGEMYGWRAQPDSSGFASGGPYTITQRWL